MVGPLRRKLALGRFSEGVLGVDVEAVDVGVTPVPPIEKIPEEYREFILEVQKTHHDQINELAIAIGEYDTSGETGRSVTG
jgi:hypothetical protein